MAIFFPNPQFFNSLQEWPPPRYSAPIYTTVTEPPDSNIFITDRLNLRPLLPSERDATSTIRSHHQVARSLTHTKPQKRSEFDAWLKPILESEKCVSHCVELRVFSQPGGEKEETSKPKMTQNEESTRVSVKEKQEQSQVIGMVDVHNVPESGYMFLLEYWGMDLQRNVKAWMEWYWRSYLEIRRSGDAWRR